MNEQDLKLLKKLWIETQIRMQAMGRILIGKKEKGTMKTSLNFGNLELNIEKKDKDGNIVHTQNIKTDGKGEILENKTWDKDSEDRDSLTIQRKNKGGKINGEVV